MKQLLQSLKNGTTEIADVPAPKLEAGYNLIQTSLSLVSPGTERMLVEFGKSNIFRKAYSQPEKLKQVLSKAKSDGVFATYDAVSSKLDQSIPLGYCNVGKIIETNEVGFEKSQRVVSNGNHAEIVSVPKNLCARIPDNVSNEEAVFTVLAAIGLQGIRLSKPTIGESFVIIGLGVIGLLTAQMLLAQGCRVLCVDLNPTRLEIAKAFGAEIASAENGENVLSKATAFSRGSGVDAVIITASTSSNDPISLAAKMSRKRGRIILVGIAGLNISRDDFYEKELSFQVSCSYGPGRYDVNYEHKGHDYPLAYVRWTEQRNFQAVLDLMSTGALNVRPLITHEFDIVDGIGAMELIASNAHSLGVLLRYNNKESENLLQRSIVLPEMKSPVERTGCGSFAFLGAGNYSGRVLIPAFASCGASLHTLVSNRGITASHFGRKFKFKYASTDIDRVLGDPEIDTIVIATRHSLHAKQVISALEADKNVFCEKPLCLSLEELDQIENIAMSRRTQKLMVGFNRRFSPLIVKMKQLISPLNSPKCVIMNINAGELPLDHWTHDPKIGGGRLVGEGCHFIDLARHLVNSPIRTYHATALKNEHKEIPTNDTVTVVLGFQDGSTATLHYLSNGHKGFPKERVEVFTDGKILQLNNYKRLIGWGWPNFKSASLWRQDKGQRHCVGAFMASIIDDKVEPISREEIFEVSRVTLQLSQQLGA